MTPTTAAEKVKEIIKSWDIYAYGPVWDEMEEEKVKEWLATEEGSRLVGELGEGIGRKEYGLLRELTMRSHLGFPENKEDLKWFDEGLKNQNHFHIRLFNVLDIGDSDIQNEQFEKGVNEQEEAIKEVENLPMPDFDKMAERIIKRVSELSPEEIQKRNFYNMNRPMDI